MSLLVDIETSALDPGYAEAAARRAPSAQPDEAHAAHGPGRGLLARAGATGPRRLTVVAVLALAGLLVATSLVQARLREPSLERARSALQADVTRQAAQTEALGRQLDSLRAQLTRARDNALTATSAGAALAARLNTLEAQVGTTPVSGPGLLVSLDDAPSPPAQQDPLAADHGDGVNRILDRDVQAVVNALWAAGATAVGVNGVRLSAQTAIRTAGQAILVDFQPLSPPYDVTAVGDPVALETAFARSPTAAQFRTYVQVYGIGFSYKRVSRVSLPPAGSTSLRFAQAQGKGPS